MSLKKKAFTLAEVLITLGIIGVVAAMTIPTLIAKHQKHVYYTQFRKAATILETALQRYEFDNGCIGDLSGCGRNSENWGAHGYLDEIDNFIEGIAKYFNIATKINSDNYQEICGAYDKSNIKEGYNTSNTYFDSFICGNDMGEKFDNLTAFITTDGMLYTFTQDQGAAGGNFIDVNGPNKGPNALGRDIFMFYISKKIYWSGDENIDGWLCEPDSGYGCANKLLKEGKMNY